MKQTMNLMALVAVIALVATFTVGAMLTVVEATATLGSAVIEVEADYFADVPVDCDTVEASDCF